MTAIIHPTMNKNKDFVTAVYSAMIALDNTGISVCGKDCIGVYRRYDEETDTESTGWTIMETKDTHVGGFKTLNGINIRVLAVITAKW